MPIFESNPYKQKYKKLQAIGKGKFGTVYKVQSISDGKLYVAKHMPLDSISQKTAQKQIQIIQTLRHPYIVQYIQSYRSSFDFIIIMQYCPQRDLAYHIQLMKKKKKQFNQNIVINWLFQLVLGLQYVHSKKVLHRDIKPENVFLDENMNVKIGDFGVSKMLSQTQQCCKTTAGTLAYLAPQICEQDKYTSKADIWSLGCVIYQICSLQKPFYGAMFKIIDQIKSAKIKQIPQHYSNQLRNLVLKMMTRNQSKRPNTIMLLKDPVLVDLMIKNSSSMCLQKQYKKCISQQKPQNNLTSSFIDKQTNLVHDQLRLFQQQVKLKMNGLKNKSVNNQIVQKQYKQIKLKMQQIQSVINKAFNQLRKKSSIETNDSSNASIKESNQSLKSSINPNKNHQTIKQQTITNRSGLSNSSDMTIIQSVQIGDHYFQNNLKNKSKMPIQSSSNIQQSEMNQSKKQVHFNSNNSSMISSAQSQLMTNSSNFSKTYKSINLTENIRKSKGLDLNQSQSFEQTLKSEYQKTMNDKQITDNLAKQTLTKLQFLQKTLSQNPDAIMNDSLLNFTLTISQESLNPNILFGKTNKPKSSQNIDDSVNFQLTKRQPGLITLRNSQNPFKKKQNKQQCVQQQYENDQFQNYEDDFQAELEQGQLNYSQAQLSMKQKRKSQLDTIISFYQQTLQQINNSQLQPQSLTKKVKNKYPLIMSQIKQQTGEWGSVYSKNSTTSNNSFNNSR